MKVRTLTIRCAALFASAALAGTASAQIITTGTQYDWSGFFVGANIGGAWNNTCNSWSPGSIISGSPALSSAFYNRDCPDNSAFMGGAQFGYMFQWHDWVWGLGVDYEGWNAKNQHRSYTYTGAVPPPNGTYSFYGKSSPNGLFLLGPRIGYAFGPWFPYARIGGAFTSGTHKSTASFTDANGTASFTGGKNYNSNGFNAGAGVAFAFAPNWALAAEYNYVSLGKGSNSVTNCSGSAAACAEFGQVRLENTHNSVTVNMFRLSVNYDFYRF